MGFLDHLTKRHIPDTDLVKAGAGVASPKEAAKPSSWELDQQTWYESLADSGLSNPTQQGTIGLPYETLRQMSRVPLISAIIQTRINQVAEFCFPQKDPYSLGYKIAMRENEKQPSRAAKKKIEEYTRWWQTCGDVRLSYDDRLETLVRKIIRDSLSFDQAAFEIVRTRGGKISGVVSVDGTTIRRAALTETERAQGRRDYGNAGYVQIIDSKIRARYTPEEMVFGIRRPRTWIRVNGYGFPELEELVRVVANLLNAEQYNAANFKNGMHAAGVLAIKSKMSAQLFRAFQRNFYLMLKGAANSHKTPLIQLDPENKEELQNINMSHNNREMEYDKWISFLLRQAAMVFQMDPSELGYQFGNEGQSNVLNNTGVVDKVTYSRERGLRPLLRALESWFNVVQFQIDPDFEFRFAGFDAKSERDKIDLDTKAIKAFRTVDETRAMYDLEPMGPEKGGDLILDPGYMNAMSMKDAQEAEGEGAPEGEEGAPEGEESPAVEEEVADMFANVPFNEEKAPGDDKTSPPPPEKAMEKGGIKSITVEID